MRLLFILLFPLFPILACNDSNEKEIVLKNSLDTERQQELVTISKAIILNLAKKKEKKLFPVVIGKNKDTIPSQLEDLNKDGIWDLLLFTVNFKPLERKKIFIDFTSQKPNYKHTTDIYFGVKDSVEQTKSVITYKRYGDPRSKTPKKTFQMEGPAWENDKVGFRIYFDPRNSIDIFGKTTSETVLTKIGVSGNYHIKSNWGMDILKVGNSLGAGSIAIKYKDSIYRVTGYKGAFFRIIKDGPIRSSFEMIYLKEIIQNHQISVRHKISITKGQWYYKSEVTISGLTKDMKLITGIANLKPNKVTLDTFQKHFIMSSYGKQSENGDHLGMGIFLNEKYYGNHKTIKKSGDVSNSHYVSLKTKNNIPIPFYFLSGWEASSKQFRTEKEFQQVLKNTIISLLNPIEISYK